MWDSFRKFKFLKLKRIVLVLLPAVVYKHFVQGRWVLLWKLIFHFLICAFTV